jgi:excinuclease UvrABC nuclease subunit
MINCKRYDELLKCNPEDIKSKIESHLFAESISFLDVDSFPDNNGLYFVFLGSAVLYIGKADKQSIKDRCKQYTNNSSGGTLRKKIECVCSCSSSDATSYISNSLTAKFIVIEETKKISTLEEVAIWAFQPKLNVIKPSTFTYENLVL